MIAAHGIVDVDAEMVTVGGHVAIEQRRKDLQRHRRRDEARIGRQRGDHALAEFSRRLAVRRQLLVALHQRRLRARGRAAVFPVALIHDAAEIRHIGFAQHVGNADQHRFRSEPRRDLQRGRPARRFENERRRALVQRGVVKLVEDVVDEQLHLPVLVDLGFRESVEAPEARQLRALVCGEQGAAVDLGAIDRRAAQLPGVVDLVFTHQAERLVRDVGQRKPDIARVKRGIGRSYQRLRHFRLHQHHAAEHAPFVGDLAGDFEVDAADEIGRAGRDDRGGDAAYGRIDGFTRVVDIGLEQRSAHQQVAIEQLPLVADFDRGVLLRPEYLVRAAIDDGRESTVVRAGAVELGAHRIRRSRIGDIDAGDRQRLYRGAEIEVRHSEIRSLVAPGAHRSRRRAYVGPTTRLDAVVVVTDPAVEDDQIVVVGGIDQVTAHGIDGDLRRLPGQAWRGKRFERVSRIEYARAGRRPGAAERAATAAVSFRGLPEIGVDAVDFAGNLHARDGGMMPASGVEFVRRLALVIDDVSLLTTALRVRGERSRHRTLGYRRFRDRADVIQQRSRGPNLVAEHQVGRNLDLDIVGCDVLMNREEVAIHDAVEGIAIATAETWIGTAGIGVERYGLAGREGVRHAGSGGVRPIIRHAEIRQAVDVGVKVVRGDLHAIDGLPGRRHEPAAAIVGSVVAAFDVAFLEHAAGADREGRADQLVDVERDAFARIGRDRLVHIVEAFFGRRLLGDDVDRAARRATAGKRRTGTTQDLDLLGEEILANA